MKITNYKLKIKKDNHPRTVMLPYVGALIQNSFDFMDKH